MLDLEAVERRVNAATQGPWINDDNEGFSRWKIWERCAPSGHRKPGAIIALLENDCEEDAAFIAHARTDIPALLAEIHKLREALVLVRMSGSWQLLADETKRIIDAAITDPKPNGGNK